MRDANIETLCARLCLLTRAAWADGLPPPLTRPMVHRLCSAGALSGLVLREDDGVEPALLERARALLGRTRAVYDLLCAYQAKGYCALLPQEREWPEALSALGMHEPLFLFARGNLSLLEGHRIAVAGSRDISPGTQAYARRVGEALAAEGITLVCGGARGIDRATQEGLLSAGGKLILVPATPVEQQLADASIRHALDEGRLLILCDALPDGAFSAQRALERNHVIYALGEAALVLAARDGVGGSWRGAADCLRGGYTPVFVPEECAGDSSDQAGCRALLGLGARTFSLDSAKTIIEQTVKAIPKQTSFLSAERVDHIKT